MKIGDREIGPDQAPYIVAELGVNHDGSLSRAIELAEAAHRAGADAIKLQWFEADRLLSQDARLATYQKQRGVHDPIELLQRLQLQRQAMEALVRWTHEMELHAIVTVFSMELVDEANDLPWDAYKTASPDLVNKPLLDALMTTGTPLLVSAGAASLDEVRAATQWLGDHPHIMLQCVSAYPTPIESASLAGRAAMQSVNANAIGYSDHTMDVQTGALAVASGACLLEKHITHDRTALGPDHAASLDAEDFAAYVVLARRAHAAMGDAVKHILDIEQDVRCVSRQSITTTRQLRGGHILERDDLTVKRPGDGLPPERLDDLVGCTLARPVEANVLLRDEDLA